MIDIKSWTIEKVGNKFDGEVELLLETGERKSISSRMFQTSLSSRGPLTGDWYVQTSDQITFVVSPYTDLLLINQIIKNLRRYRETSAPKVKAQ